MTSPSRIASSVSSRVARLACTVLTLWLLPAALAQQSTAPQGQIPPPAPELKINPLKALQNSEPALNEEYQLGPGDEITLEFPGHPELAGKHIVGPDGRITLPIAGAVAVADQSRTGVAKVITDALAPFYTDVTVTVRIDKYGSNRVLVLGNVAHPGVLYFDETPTLLDVVARGGLLPSTSTTSAGVRDGIPERCMIYRGNDKVFTVELRSLLQTGNALADLRLRRNDIVFIPAQQELFISVIGEVRNPGAIPLTPDTTLRSLIAVAGGLAESAGSSPKIQIIQPSTGNTVVIPFKDLLNPAKGQEVTLHAGDMVFVPKSGFYKATYVLSKISPITTLATLATIAAP